MDKEQAIDLLDNLIGMIEDNQDNDYDTAFRMAIEALKAQLSQQGTTKDAISRQWLLDCINEGWIKFDTDKDANRFIHLVRDIAPSAQPEPHEGEWINTNPEYKNGFYNNSYYCSECHDYYTTSPYEMKFCPNCGAKMKGAKHETN